MKIKDKKIQIFKSVGKEGKWTAVFESPIWASTWQDKADLDRFEGDIVRVIEVRNFCVNYHAEITPKMLLKYKSAWYKIIRVDTQDGYNSDMFLKGERVADLPEYKIL